MAKSTYSASVGISLLSEHERRHAAGPITYGEDSRTGFASGAHVRHIEAGRLQTRLRRDDIERAPRQAPGFVGSVAHAIFQCVRDLDDEIAATKEHESHAPLGTRAIERHLETEARAV